MLDIRVEYCMFCVKCQFGYQVGTAHEISCNLITPKQEIHGVMVSQYQTHSHVSH